MKFSNPKLVLSVLAISGFLTSTHAAHATMLAQRCELGATCSIPGNDGGLTYINITPATGNKYKCDVKSNDDTLRVWISGGKEFTMHHGDGYQKAAPSASVDITGEFKNPQNPNDLGQIKVRRIGTGTGTIVCTAVK